MIVYPYRKLKNALNSRVLKKYSGPARQRKIWDAEYLSGQWDYLDFTQDVIYMFIYRYIKGSSLLDLGCGTGNTGIEIDPLAYTRYTGVDISEVAIKRAKNRAYDAGRQEKNDFMCADIYRYVPTRNYQIILFRESIFYFPLAKIRGMLSRYSKYLEPDGVFIIRMNSQRKFKRICEFIYDRHKVIDGTHEKDEEAILVFRP